MIMKNLKKYFSFEVQVLNFFVCCLSKFGGSVLSDVSTTWRCLTTKMFGEDFGLPIIRSTSIESDSQWSTWGSYLSVNDACEAIYLYHADALRRGLESDSVQSFWLHQTSLWWRQLICLPRFCMFSLHGFLMSSTLTGTNYIETLRVQIHANCRIRRIYFSDRLYTEDELPQEFKLFLPYSGLFKLWKLSLIYKRISCTERWWARKLLSLLRGLFILSYLNMSSYYLLETLWTKFWYNQASNQVS